MSVTVICHVSYQPTAMSNVIQHKIDVLQDLGFRSGLHLCLDMRLDCYINYQTNRSEFKLILCQRHIIEIKNQIHK